MLLTEKGLDASANGRCSEFVFEVGLRERRGALTPKADVNITIVPP